MKEELTTKMHSEFTVTPETEVKHRCFCALMLLPKDSTDSDIEKRAKQYGVSLSDVKKYSDDYYRLNK